MCSGCNALIKGTFPSDSTRHRSAKKLKISKNTCPLCSLILHCCSESTVEVEIYANPQDEGYSWSISTDSVEKVYFSRFKEEGPFLLPRGTNYFAEQWDQSPIQRTGLTFVAADSWMRKCLKHEKCQRAIHSKLPTRVLDVGCDKDDQQKPPALLVNSSESQRYVTLSYCWGGAQPLMLTLENLSTFTRGIPMSDFPLLFQDAIRVVRALEIRFLWIDALCIVQPSSDGGKDWAVESTKMRSVYANSVFTISAAASHSPKDGLFSWRSDRFVRITPPSQENPFCIGASLHVRNQDSKMNAKRRWSDHIEALPISRRAWTLQERFLPPAVLHFDQDDACWECKTGIYDGRQGRRELDHEVTPDFKLMVSLDATWRRDDTLGRWYKLVEIFQARSITKVEDRLIAFGGLAESLSQKLKSEYFAGLWQKDLQRGLLWMRAPEYKNRDLGQTRYNGKAPSWSWAHIDQPIAYHLELSPPDSKFSWTMLFPSKEQRLDVGRVDLHTLHGRFGAVEEGLLVAEGVIEQSVWEDDGFLQGCNEPLSYRFDDDNITGPLSLLLVGSWENIRIARTLFLVLQHVRAGQSYYRRVGVAWFEWDIDPFWLKQKARNVSLRVSKLMNDAKRMQVTLV